MIVQGRKGGGGGGGRAYMNCKVIVLFCKQFLALTELNLTKRNKTQSQFGQENALSLTQKHIRQGKNGISAECSNKKGVSGVRVWVGLPISTASAVNRP